MLHNFSQGTLPFLGINQGKMLPNFFEGTFPILWVPELSFVLASFLCH